MTNPYNPPDAPNPLVTDTRKGRRAVRFGRQIIGGSWSVFKILGPALVTLAGLLVAITSLVIRINGDNENSNPPMIVEPASEGKSADVNPPPPQPKETLTEKPPLNVSVGSSPLPKCFDDPELCNDFGQTAPPINEPEDNYLTPSAWCLDNPDPQPTEPPCEPSPPPTTLPPPEYDEYEPLSFGPDNELWQEFCGAFNPTGEIVYIGQPDADGLSYEELRCFEPLMVVLELESFGNLGVVGFEHWANMSQEQALQESKLFESDYWLWGLAMKVLDEFDLNDVPETPSPEQPPIVVPPTTIEPPATIPKISK